MNLATLQIKTSDNFQDNLKNLERIIQEVPKNSLVLSSELCLTGYAYNDLQNAADFTTQATASLKKQSLDKTIGLTMTTKEGNDFFNTFFLFDQGEIIHTQHKAQLFTVNNEDDYFKAGKTNAVKLFEFNGLKIGVLICFELRFIELWQQLKGADIILVPALWGVKRKDNFETLYKALAIANQCFVIASDSANEECAKGSGIVTPFGEVFKDDTSQCIMHDANLKALQEMREKLFVGINV